MPDSATQLQAGAPLPEMALITWSAMKQEKGGTKSAKYKLLRFFLDPPKIQILWTSGGTPDMEWREGQRDCEPWTEAKSTTISICAGVIQ